MFSPNFPVVPTSKQIYNLLLDKYPSDEQRIKFTDLHLRTYESRSSMKDTVGFLNSQLYQPRKDLAPLLLELPIQWDMNPYNDRNWCLHLNSLRSLDRYFANYEKKSDIRFLDMPYKFISDYSLFHVGVLGHIRKHFFLLDDMTCGIRQSRISYLVDKHMSGIYEINDQSILKILSKLIHFQWKVLSDTANFKSTNHTISLLHALMSLVRVFDIDTKELWEQEICRCFDHLVQSQFDEYGIHTENSPEYHFFALKLFTELVKTSWYDASSIITKKVLKSAEEMGKWMRYPDGRVLPIGDSAGKKPLVDLKQWVNVNNDVIDWTEDLECLLHPMYLMIKKVYQNRWTFFAMKAGHLIETHRHRDDLSYIWSENGIDIVIDPGKYAYTKNAYRSFVKSQRAHNTISFFKTVRNKKKVFDFEPSGTLPSCDRFFFGKHVRHFKKIAETGILFVRNIYFRPKCWMVVIDNITGSDEDVVFSSNIHFAPEFSWNEIDPFLLQTKHDNGDFLEITYCSNNYLTVVSSSGDDTNSNTNGFISREYRKVEACPYIEFSGTGNAIVAIALNLSREPLELELNEEGFTLLYSDEKIVLENS